MKFYRDSIGPGLLPDIFRKSFLNSPEFPPRLLETEISSGILQGFLLEFSRIFPRNFPGVEIPGKFLKEFPRKFSWISSGNHLGILQPFLSKFFMISSRIFSGIPLEVEEASSSRRNFSWNSSEFHP